MTRRRKLAIGLALGCCGVALAVVGGVTWAAFSSNTSNSGNTFSAAGSFQTLDHFDIDTIPTHRHSGKVFSVTVRAKDSSNATVTSFNGTVALSTNNGSTIAPTTSGSFSNGVLTQNVTVTGAYATDQTITATSAGKTGTSNAFTLHDWKYYFAKSTGETGTNCGTAARKRDMEEGYAGSDPEETFDRNSSSVTLRFCSPTFAAGDTLSAGTTNVYGYVHNSAGSTCNITAQLLKNGTSLGSISITIPQQTGTTLRTWAIPSSATTFASGDRLNLLMTWQGVKACDSTALHYGGTVNRSRVELPGP